MMDKHLRRITGFFIGITLFAGSPFLAGSKESFEGKTIKFVVAYSPGGSFDAYTRLIARHIGKHLSGNPSSIVQNMTGAGGMITANHVYNTAKPDGLTIGAFAAPLILQDVMGNKAAKYDGRKFGWLGVPAANQSVCSFNQKSGIRSVDDWLASKKEVFISAIGPGTSTSDIPKLLRAALGLPTKVIDGYRGGAKARLAVEAEEVDGYCGSWQTVKAIWREPFESGRIRVVIQNTLESHPDLKDVPLAIDYAKTPEARQLLEVADYAHRGQFPYSTPPGISEERLQALQKAFIDTLNDPELRAEAKRLRLEIDPIDGPKTANNLGKLYDMEPELITKLKAIVLPKK